jgi:hypothetical protein
LMSYPACSCISLTSAFVRPTRHPAFGIWDSGARAGDPGGAVDHQGRRRFWTECVWTKRGQAFARRLLAATSTETARRLQVGLILAFVGLTAWRGLAFHHVVGPGAALPLWSPMVDALQRLGDQWFGNGNYVANPVTYVLLPLPVLLLAGARLAALGFGPGHQVKRVLVLWCAIPLVIFTFALRGGQLTVERLAGRFLSNALNNAFARARQTKPRSNCHHRTSLPVGRECHAGVRVPQRLEYRTPARGCPCQSRVGPSQSARGLRTPPGCGPPLQPRCRLWDKRLRTQSVPARADCVLRAQLDPQSYGRPGQ